MFGSSDVIRHQFGGAIGRYETAFRPAFPAAYENASLVAIVVVHKSSEEASFAV
jgi:hypothetical protein